MNCERWSVDCLRGWNADLTDPGPVCGGGGEAQVTSIEARGQPDTGWLAATLLELQGTGSTPLIPVIFNRIQIFFTQIVVKGTSTDLYIHSGFHKWHVVVPSSRSFHQPFSLWKKHAHFY